MHFARRHVRGAQYRFPPCGQPVRPTANLGPLAALRHEWGLDYALAH